MSSSDSCPAQRGLTITNGTKEVGGWNEVWRFENTKFLNILKEEMIKYKLYKLYSVELFLLSSHLSKWNELLNFPSTTFKSLFF